MSTNETLDQSPSEQPSAPRPEDLWRRNVAVGVFVAVLFLPLVMYGCGPEWARWDSAQAVIAYDEGDIEQAIFQLSTAVERSPRDPSLKINLARKLIESRRGREAEMLCDEVLDRFPDNDVALVVKAQSQQSQGKFLKALKTFNLRAQQRNWLIGNSPEKLNERAYFRALAGVRLEEAKKDIDAATEIVGKFSFGSWRFRPGFYHRSLIASAMVACKIGMAQEAIDQLTPTVQQLRQVINDLELELNELIINDTIESFPPEQTQSHQHDDVRALLREFEYTLSTILTVRAYGWQTLDAQALCDQDRAEVRSMALDADEILESLPGDRELISTIQLTSAFLDTRGYIVGLMPQTGKTEELSEFEIGEDVFGDEYDDSNKVKFSLAFNTSLKDLDQSIFAIEVFRKSLESDIHNHVDGPVQDVVSLRKEVSRNQAVLLYHRMVIRKRSGDEKAALEDAAAIRELGHVPGEHLF